MKKALYSAAITRPSVLGSPYSSATRPYLAQIFSGIPFVTTMGFSFVKNRRTGVAFFLGGIPVFFVAGEIHLGLAFFCLCFLQAQNIRLIFLYERRKKAFFMDRA